MNMVRLMAVVCVVLFAEPVSAQVFVGNCRLSSGSGSPEGVVVGRPCDLYLNTANGVLYGKWSGTNTNTGWGVGHNANAYIGGSLDIVSYVGVPGHVSQLTGWRVDSLGAADFRHLYVDELHAKSFIADLEQALAGGQIIAKSVAVLAAGFSCPTFSGTTTLTVEDLPGANAMQVFQSGDWVIVRNFSRASGSLTIGDCVGQVTSPSTPGGTQTWTFTRGSSGNAGTMVAGTVVPAKNLVIDYGVSGNGYHEVNAMDGAYGLNAPYSQVVTWAGSPVVGNRTVRTRLGNLRGITGTTDEYGVIAGAYAATNGTYFRASNSAFELHGIDLSLWQGATKTFFVDHAVPSLAIGSPVPSAYGTGTGVWMGNTGPCYGFRVGVPGGAGLFWDCVTSTLTVRGTAGSAANQIPNSSCHASTENWDSFTNSGLTKTLSFALSPWRLNDESNTCYVFITGTPAVGTITQAYTSPLQFPVVAGNRYEASTYLGVQRSGNTNVVIQWKNAAGGVISSSTGSTCTSASAGGTTLSGYCRSVIIDTAPALAVNAGVVIQTVHIGGSPDGTDPFVFFVRSFFGEATSTQTLASEWGPSGLTEITGGMIRTGTVTTTHLNFTPATSTNVVATINASAEGIQITGNRIAINGSTTFSAGYDPTGRIASGGAAADVNANVTTISGGKITALSITAAEIAAATITGAKISGGTVTADKLSVSTLSAITADIGTVTAGTVNFGTNFSASSGGISIGGATISALGGAVYVNGNLTVEGNIQGGTGGGEYVAANTVIANDDLQCTNCPSDTGTDAVFTGDSIRLKSSSLRYKENVKEMMVQLPLAILTAKPIRFDYRRGTKNVVGLSAEDLASISADLVNVDRQGRPESIRQETFNVYLLGAIQALRTELDALKP